MTGFETEYGGLLFFLHKSKIFTIQRVVYDLNASFIFHSIQCYSLQCESKKSPTTQRAFR